MTMRNNQLEQALIAAGFQKQKEVHKRKTQLHDVTEPKQDWEALTQRERDAFSAMFSEK